MARECCAYTKIKLCIFSSAELSNHFVQLTLLSSQEIKISLPEKHTEVRPSQNHCTKALYMQLTCQS